jgi:hypothetical protein
MKTHIVGDKIQAKKVFDIILLIYINNIYKLKKTSNLLSWIVPNIKMN